MEEAPLHAKPVADIGVGLSDSVLLVVSVIGFGVLTYLVYSIIVVRAKTVEQEVNDSLTPDERLAQADVAQLTRAQRRARARNLMKEQRRVGPLERPRQHDDDGDGEHDQHALAALPQLDDDGSNNAAEDNPRAHLSRKERARQAKVLERDERRKFEEQRQLQHQAEQEERARQKHQLERQQKLEQEQQTQQLLLQQQAEKVARQAAYETFLTSSTRTQSVDEWQEQIKQERVKHIVDIADSFGVDADLVVQRIETLRREGRVTGVLINQRATFMYLSYDDLQELASLVLSRGSMSLQDLAESVLRKHFAMNASESCNV